MKQHSVSLRMKGSSYYFPGIHGSVISHHQVSVSLYHKIKLDS